MEKVFGPSHTTVGASSCRYVPRSFRRYKHDKLVLRAAISELVSTVMVFNIWSVKTAFSTCCKYERVHVWIHALLYT